MSNSIFLSILLTSIVSINIGQHINEDIHCLLNETECTIECSKYRNCALSSIFCNNATRCNIICSQQESCTFATIYHTLFNEYIEIDCLYPDSCKYLSVKSDQINPDYNISSNSEILNNRSLILNSLNISSSPSMILSDIATFSNYKINCLFESSCNGIEIEINNINSQYIVSNLNFNMNIDCLGIESCKHMILSVSDDWNAYTFWEWINFTISIQCNAAQSCQDVHINTQNLKINSETNTTTSFGDLYIDCSNVDKTCLFMDIICPDLIPFNTMYDYLYQPKKCHIALNNSYNNHISIFSKHGMNTIDLECNDTDNLICDGIILYCTEHAGYSYFCDMEYNDTDNEWFCDNYNNLYIFDTNYSYGCDQYIWLHDIAIIHTSKIPNYTNQTSLSCNKYNPSLSLKECYIYCDAPYSCKVDYVFCNNVSTKCHFECSGLRSCKKDGSPRSIYIECPAISGSICSSIINPGLLLSDYGKFYTNYFMNAKQGNYIDFEVSHNLIAYIYDYGMFHADFKILNSDNLLDWTDQYDVGSFWRVINVANTNTNKTQQMPVSIDILCDRCHADWFSVSGYDNNYNRNISVELQCNECSGTEFDFWGITEFTFDCIGSCSQSSLTFTDSNTNINCYQYKSCDDTSIYLKISNYSSYIDNTYEYNLNLLNVSSGIKMHSLYGFNQLDINYNFSETPEISYYCGSPDYFNKYDNYDAINETECLISNPLYQSTAVASFEYEFSGQSLTSQIIYCSPYQSCSRTKIYCIGDECILHCDGQFSCLNAEIYTNYYDMNDIKQTQKHLKVYCTNWGACHFLKIYANDIDYVEVNCLNSNSCPRTRIYYSDALNPAKGLNLTCYDITKRELIIPTNDRYYTSCRDLWIYCPFTKCHINIEKALYVDPWDINIFYAKGFNELDLQCQYNPLTNQSTCHDVNYFCHLNDSTIKAGDISAYYQYHSTFNRYNGECIGECCHYIFSYSPTTSPSTAPTYSPTAFPTYLPTFSPTTAPTRSPTIFTFDGFFNVTFYIIIQDDRKRVNDIKRLNGITATINDIAEALEYGYLYASSTSKSYDEYSVKIKHLSFSQERMNVTTTVYVSKSVVSHFAQFTKNNINFDNHVAERLKYEWNVSNVEFDAYSNSILVRETVSNVYIYNQEITDYDYNIGSIAFVSFTVFIWIIGTLSFFHTKGRLRFLDKLPKIKPCDDEQYLAIIRYGMQTLDLYSDIAFCWELYEFSDVLNDNNDLTVIRILYSLSFTFFIIPYTINLILAVIFTKLIENKHGITKLSVFTQNWFNKYSKLFSILVIISGSVSASLRLINSSMFGHEFFYSGFSKYQLSEMSKFRILFTVLIENMPQFMIQLFYLNYFKDKTDIVSFTFVVSTASSIISILSSLMEYFLKKQHKPTYQTKFNIEIILIIEEQQKELQQFGRTGRDKSLSKSEMKIEIRDPNVKKLHKRGNLRKNIKESIAKCISKLPDNFEFIYCFEQIDGLIVHGLCSSDDPKTLHQLFVKYKHELINIVKKVYKIDGKIKLKKSNKGLLPSNSKKWKVDFIVFDENGRNMDNSAIELTQINADNKSFRLKKEKKDSPKNRTETVEVVEYCD